MVSGSFLEPDRRWSVVPGLEDSHLRLQLQLRQTAAPEIPLCTLSDRCPDLTNLEESWKKIQIGNLWMKTYVIGDTILSNTTMWNFQLVAAAYGVKEKLLQAEKRKSGVGCVQQIQTFKRSLTGYNFPQDNSKAERQHLQISITFFCNVIIVLLLVKNVFYCAEWCLQEVCNSWIFWQKVWL